MSRTLDGLLTTVQIYSLREALKKGEENKWARATYRSQSIARSALSLTDTDMTAAQAQT